MKFITVLFFVNFLSFAAQAFPEMVRHGYSSCTACHVSPTGGGLLTDYGRELSRELLSSFGREKESDFLYGAVNLPEWLGLGGDYRALQVVQKTETVERALFFTMQLDIQAAVFLGPVSIVGVLGQDTSRSGNGELISRRHYIKWQASDHTVLRAGRFYPEFGLKVANHRRSTRFFFKFDQGEETLNIEASWSNEKFGFFATGLLSTPGVALSAHAFINEKSRLGVSYRFLNDDENTSSGVIHTGSASAIWSFSEKLFVMTEAVLQIEDEQNSAADFVRVNWEVFKGLHIFAVQELHRADLSDENSDTVGFGGGMQFFPRPHFEFLAEYQKKRSPRTVGFSEDSFIFLMHFYL